jgi:hypothetical protein
VGVFDTSRYLSGDVWERAWKAAWEMPGVGMQGFVPGHVSATIMDSSVATFAAVTLYCGSEGI